MKKEKHKKREIRNARSRKILRKTAAVPRHHARSGCRTKLVDSDPMVDYWSIANAAGRERVEKEGYEGR